MAEETAEEEIGHNLRLALQIREEAMEERCEVRVGELLEEESKLNDVRSLNKSQVNHLVLSRTFVISSQLPSFFSLFFVCVRH